MAPRKTKKLWVRLTWEQWTQLRRAARLESGLRGEEIAAGTLLRELGFPRVLDRLTELEAPSLRSEEDRRSGEDRRAALAGSREP